MLYRANVVKALGKHIRKVTYALEIDTIKQISQEHVYIYFKKITVKEENKILQHFHTLRNNDKTIEAIHIDLMTYKEVSILYNKKDVKLV